MTTAVEVVSYKLRDGIGKSELTLTHDDINSFCSEQPGFLYRSISHDQNDMWFDIVYWQDIECAKAAGEAFMANEKCQALSKLIDNETLVMRHMLAEAEKVGIPAGQINPIRGIL